MKVTELLTEKEQSLSKNLNKLTRSEKNMYYLVQDATSQSEGGDVIAHVDGNSFAHIFIGADHGETAAKENWVLYHDNQKDEAIADANERLKYAKSEYTVTESLLKEAIDNEYQYKISRSFDSGKTWEYDEGDMYDSLKAAKRIKSNMMRPKAIGKKVKIERIKRTKLAGPKKKLP